MKLVSLLVQAFGPYADCQIIDFAELKGRSFFLIHGPTGAGKTTLLDAICFALYGTASGSEREAKTLRSDHAPLTTLTEVQFTFALGEQCYFLRRSPEQLRPKKRGAGTTLREAEAELWRLAGDDKMLQASGWSEVSRRVEDLLGFKSSQFRQVVLLPQGEFRKLLTAGSTERQEILQTLFKTDVYRDIELALKEKAQQVKKHFTGLAEQCQWLLQEAEASSAVALQERYVQDERQYEHQQRVVAECVAVLRQTQQNLSQGQADASLLAEAAAAVQHLTSLQGQQAAIAETRQRWEQAVAAATLYDAERQLQQLQGEEQRVKQQVDDAAEALTAAKQALQTASVALASEQRQAPVREEAARKLLEFARLGEQVAAYQEARRGAEQRQQEAGRCQQRQQEAAAHTARCQEQLAHCRQQLQAVQLAAVQVGEYEVKAKEAAKAVEQYRVYQDLTVQQQALQQAAQAAEQVYRQQEQEYQQAKKRWQEAQRQWQAAQAAILAASLCAGTPCPVCGSQHHPAPASADGAATMTLAAWEQQQQQLSERETALQAAYEGWQQGQRQVERVSDQRAFMAAQLPAGELTLGALEQHYTEMQHKLQAAQAAGLQAAQLAKEEAALVREQEQSAAAVLALQQQWQAAEQEYQTAAAVAEERLQLVPIEWQQPQVLAEAEQQVRKQAEELQANFEQAREGWQSCKEEVVKAEAAVTHLQTTLSVLQHNLQVAEADFAVRLRAKGFVDTTMYQQAKCDESLRESWQQELTAFAHELAAAQERQIRAQRAAAEVVAPDLTALEAAVEAAQLQHNEALAAQAVMAQRQQQQHRWLTQLSALEHTMSAYTEQYRIVGRLAEVANGDNPHRLTLQRFVLAALLEDVAQAANMRLKTMSRSRYLLQRTSERARKNSAGGLELEVFDSYTGLARPVGTLSGGEMFLASLSLALGLADVVQAYAGGIRLDTILVDEGFGTLDPEALDLAMKALLDLQRGGRTVGIISHVPELKERIDACLEIRRTEAGSRAAFMVKG